MENTKQSGHAKTQIVKLANAPHEPAVISGSESCCNM